MWQPKYFLAFPCSECKPPALNDQPPPAEKAAARPSPRIFRPPEANGDQLAAIADLIVKGTVKVNVETVLPLPEARKAQDLSKTGHSGGKIVLEVLT